MEQNLVLYGYWRSSAAYRVRIALNLKRLAYESKAVHLVNQGGEQHLPDFQVLNPQEMVPCLVDNGRVFTQSMAAMEYLDETRPTPALLPADPEGRARVRALSQIVACDVHPIGNLRVLQHLTSQFGADEEAKGMWSRHWIHLGLQAMEVMLSSDAATGCFCHGDEPTMADVCLVPQVYNALRWKLPMDKYPTVRRIQEACQSLDAFMHAAPEVQPDAPTPG
jgi:maleylacetoacetate isomerase